jgi:hypothetical protein
MIGETEVGFNRTLHEGYINDGMQNKSCFPLKYFEIMECEIYRNDFEVKVSDIVGYFIKREDSNNQFFYKWDEMGLVLKNIPVLPYVVESKPIYITVYDPDRGILAEAYFTYTPRHLTSVAMGCIFDRDYYPDFNPYEPIKGDKITIAKVWMQTSLRIKEGARIIVRLPHEIIINVEIPEDNMDVWLTNMTEIDCTSIQGLHPDLQCHIHSLFCARNYLPIMNVAEFDTLLKSDESEMYTDRNCVRFNQQIEGEQASVPRVQCFLLDKCYLNRRHYELENGMDNPISSEHYNLIEIKEGFKPLESEEDQNSTSSDDQ